MCKGRGRFRVEHPPESGPARNAGAAMLFGVRDFPPDRQKSRSGPVSAKKSANAQACGARGAQAFGTRAELRACRWRLAGCSLGAVCSLGACACSWASAGRARGGQNPIRSSGLAGMQASRPRSAKRKGEWAMSFPRSVEGTKRTSRNRCACAGAADRFFALCFGRPTNHGPAS